MRLSDVAKETEIFFLLKDSTESPNMVKFARIIRHWGKKEKRWKQFTCCTREEQRDSTNFIDIVPPYLIYSMEKEDDVCNAIYAPIAYFEQGNVQSTTLVMCRLYYTSYSVKASPM